MRPQIDLRAAAAVTAVAALATTYAAVQGPAIARSDTQGTPISAKVADRHLRFGQHVVVRGHVAGAGAGRFVALEFRAAGFGWTRIDRARTASDGDYRLAARLPGSGHVRVVEPGGSSARAAGTTAAPPASAPHRVSVAADIDAASRRIDVVAGHTVRVTGHVRPARSGRVVRLQRRGGHGWHTIARDRTSRTGRFALRYRPRRSGSAVVRVRYSGDGHLASASRTLGRMDVFRHAHASWYGPGLYGNHLGCGGRLTPSTLGVANKSLPCGTRVTFRYHGRTVRVPVVDRGPYVAGRDYDLTAATRRRLGFRGHGTILATR